MRDYLRNYLAVGVNLPLENAKKYYKIDEDHCNEQIDKAIRTINKLFKM